MTRAQNNQVRVAAVIATLLPALAAAHPGHGETTSLLLGALHPLTGTDHVLAFILAGGLAGLLGGRQLRALSAVLLGSLVAAWTTDSDGWEYAAGFMVSGLGLMAAGASVTRLYLRRRNAARAALF
jgi:hydrogenase/urease accessory protein HupE